MSDLLENRVVRLEVRTDNHEEDIKELRTSNIDLKKTMTAIEKNSQPLNLPAGEWHEIEALEDNTVFVNVFAEGKY